MSADEAQLAMGLYESGDAKTLFGVAMRRHPYHGLFADTTHVGEVLRSAPPEQIGAWAHTFLSAGVDAELDNGAALCDLMSLKTPNGLFRFKLVLVVLQPFGYHFTPSQRHRGQSQTFRAEEHEIVVPLDASDADLGRGLLAALDASR